MTRRRCKRAGILLWVTILTAVAVLAISIWHPGMGTWPRGTARLLGHIPGPFQTIAVLGDSVAAGAHDTVRGGWVTRLGCLLAADYPRARLRLRNLAHNGGNTATLIDDVRRLRRGPRPALVIIAYGLNDFDEHVPPATLEAHLRRALRLLRAWSHPPDVVLLGMPPITALSPARQGQERAYTDVIRRVAALEGAGYLDQFDLWLALGDAHLHSLRYDTEHPNRFGYSFTAMAVATFLEGAYLDGQGRLRSPRTPPTCAATLCGPR